MRIAQFMDPLSLQTFLDGSLSPHFYFEDQWGRLLTLEYALRVMDNIRVQGPSLCQAKGV